MSRYIDADALYSDICFSIDQMANAGIAVDAEYLWGKLKDALENAPTIEPKRGKWIKRKRKCEYKCSECGKIVFADDENELNFCCSCGADMREVRDE